MKASSSRASLGASSEFDLDSPYVFVVWVVPEREIVVIYFVEKGQIDRYKNEAVDKPVVAMGAKM